MKQLLQLIAMLKIGGFGMPFVSVDGLLQGPMTSESGELEDKL